MASGGIVWSVSPNHLAREVEKYGDRVIVAINAMLGYLAQMIENDAKLNAKWTDRTGNARNLLRGEAQNFAKDVVVLYLIQGVDYGKYLELCNGGKYAIVMPTLEKHYSEVIKLLKGILR